MTKIKTQCCIVGGGPAGIMLGFLLAKVGIKVVVLEKWDDFFRDFRGDTIHPSTMRNLQELGLFEDFMKLPVNKTEQVAFYYKDQKYVLGDFSYLKAVPPFIGFIPQWDFLNFLAVQAKKFSGFDLRMGTEAKDLIKKDGKVVGVKAKNKNGDIKIYADLVVGADGRKSIIRQKAGLKVVDLGSPIDVLWFKLSKKDRKDDETSGHVDSGKLMILLDRDTYWQCAFIIHKDKYKKIKKEGIKSFRSDVTQLVPDLADAVDAIKSFDDVKLLTVAVDYLPKWYDHNLICIGDAAHAMSPVGGVGVNLAIQDAVAAANVLAPVLKKQAVVPQKKLQQIQKRRHWAARVIQSAQVFIHHKIILPNLESKSIKGMSLVINVLNAFPFLRQIPARIIGIGVQPEHVSENIINSKAQS